MERKKVIICSVVGFLGLLSARLGFAAEATRIKGSQIQLSDSDPVSCIYPSGAAPLGLALGAAAAIVIAQIIVTAATGCFCCRRGSYQCNTNWRLGLICFAISWVTFLNALRLLLLGAMITGRHHTRETTTDDGFVLVTFLVVKAGVFARGALMALATAILAIVGYHTWVVAKTNDNPWIDGRLLVIDTVEDGTYRFGVKMEP